MDALNTRSRATLDEMHARIGTEFGVSEWMLIDQAMINQFAKLTQDEYFIHTDPERAAVASGAAIAGLDPDHAMRQPDRNAVALCGGRDEALHPRLGDCVIPDFGP